MKPTAEQQLIVAKAREQQNNLLINARAGAAKTTTIGLIAEAVRVPSRAICFNKKIAIELAERLPGHVETATLNSLGHRAWADLCGRRLVLKTDKNRSLARAVVNEYASPVEAEEIFEDFTTLMDGISAGKMSGYLPPSRKAQHPAVRPLIGDSSFYALTEAKYSELQQNIIDEVLRRSFAQSLEGVIDFDDQIYMSAIMPVTFSPVKLTYVDETQDLSPINHVLVKKMVRKNRLIAVGDPCQAIYGFRGASERSMHEMQALFEMEELYLTICFRSAQSIVKNARWRAPDMQWAPGAVEGSVRTLVLWGPGDLRPGDAILCRNNAPLFSMAIQLLRAGLRPQLANGDVIKGLRATMVKLGKPEMPQREAFMVLALWEDAQKSKTRNKGRVSDMASCIAVFLEQTATLADAIEMLDRISRLEGSITLSTGHRSKGLEWNRVFILDRKLLGPEGQDLNLRYVMETRAREELYYVDSEHWDEFLTEPSEIEAQDEAIDYRHDPRLIDDGDDE